MEDSDDEEFSSAEFAEQLTGEFRSKLQQLSPMKKDNKYKVLKYFHLKTQILLQKYFFSNFYD